MIENYEAKDESSFASTSARRALFLQVAVAVACAAGTVSLMRLRSWKSRHGVMYRTVKTGEFIEGIRELDDDGSEIDSLLSPFSRDLILGVQVDGEVVGIETVRILRHQHHRVGYVEDAKLLDSFRGFGLELGLRRFCLREMSKQNVDCVRHLAFEWNKPSCSISQSAGMRAVEKWGYLVLDGHAMLQRLASNARLCAASTSPYGLQQATSPCVALQALQDCVPSGLLLQYWDVFDLSVSTLRFLCSGSLYNFGEVDYISESSEGDAGCVEDEFEEVGNPLQVRSCLVFVGVMTCSLGEFMRRDDSQVCTFSVYCRPETCARRPDQVIAEVMEHVRIWAERAIESDCESVVCFFSQCLLNYLSDKLCWNPQCKLVLFQSDFFAN